MCWLRMTARLSLHAGKTLRITNNLFHITFDAPGKVL